MQWLNSSVLDNGPASIISEAANNVDLLLIRAYNLADSYATVDANKLWARDLVGGDMSLADQGSDRRFSIAALTTGTAATASSQQYHAGTATSGGAATITQTGAAWTVDEHAGRSVKITAGTGSGQVARIASNTTDTLTVAANWATQPDATSQFQILDDLHWAVVDVTNSQVLMILDEASNQVITAPNPVKNPLLYMDFTQPASVQ